MNQKLIPTILCGGVGSRLWPVSRESHPKPFITLSDGQSLLQKSFLHAVHLKNASSVLTVTNRELLFKIQDEFQSINPNKIGTDYILEPFGRNTTAALACAALYVNEKHGPDTIMLVLAADHLIRDYAAFEAAVNQAVVLASKGKLVTFGIKPTAPETGFGYIEADNHDVKRFVEKPSLEKAEEYIQSGNYLWNSGMFCFSAGTLLVEMSQHCPELLEQVHLCLDSSNELSGANTTQINLDAERFSNVEDISIDYAVMEKSKNVAVVPCDMGWSDIGSWSAMSELTPADNEGNTIEGAAITYGTTNCYIRSDSRLVGTVGVDNLMIIDTEDALLVADKASAQDVKIIFNQLKEANHPACKIHQTVHRPWGTYTVLEESDAFKIKRIVVKPGQSLSLQMHHHRSEHWIVVSGAALVVNGEQEIFVSTNESTYIPAGHRHRLTNPGRIDLVMIEVQSGQYLGEDDIVRFEDVYGRC